MDITITRDEKVTTLHVSIGTALTSLVVWGVTIAGILVLARQLASGSGGDSH